MSEVVGFESGELVVVKVMGADGPWLKLMLTWHFAKLIFGKLYGIPDVGVV